MAGTMHKMAVYLGLVEDDPRYDDGYDSYEEYEDEYGACRQYLPEELTIDRQSLAAIEAGRLSGDLLDLLRRKVIVDLPNRYY